MKTNELISNLRMPDCGQCYHCDECEGPDNPLCRLFGDAADTLEAQQKRIEELEKKLSSAVYDLRMASECWSCERNSKCHINMPVDGPDVMCGDYKWRGAADTNVCGKEVDAKPLTAFQAPIDAYKGLKRKFLVFKSDTGEAVENCFILQPDKDPAAVEALRAYARATDNATLSADILNWVGAGEEHRWIPVTERLPESGVRVIVCRGDKVEQGVFLGVNGWWKVYGTNTKKVTHWMPLPEPVKEGA